MDDLIHAKQVIAELFADLRNDSRVAIKGPLFSLAAVPLVSFNEGYSAFVKAVGDNADAMHRWMTIQMQVYTDLGPRRSGILTDFRNAMDLMYGGTVGDAAIKHDDWATLPHTILLMIKVYGDQLILQIQEGPVE